MPRVNQQKTAQNGRTNKEREGRLISSPFCPFLQQRTANINSSRALGFCTNLVFCTHHQNTKKTQKVKTRKGISRAKLKKQLALRWLRKLSAAKREAYVFYITDLPPPHWMCGLTADAAPSGTALCSVCFVYWFYRVQRLFYAYHDADIPESFIDSFSTWGSYQHQPLDFQRNLIVIRIYQMSTFWHLRKKK